uniref:Uncharacterized protein n=1 Tax=Plectus sambesii TaxID=2011161 RepID=A0A914USD0_9BILA
METTAELAAVKCAEGAARRQKVNDNRKREWPHRTGQTATTVTVTIPSAYERQRRRVCVRDDTVTNQPTTHTTLVHAGSSHIVWPSPLDAAARKETGGPSLLVASSGRQRQWDSFEQPE